MNKNEQLIELNEPFEERVKMAAEKMIEDNLDLVDIQDGQGMVLVRDGSIELDERRKTDGVVLSHLSFNEVDFFVCAS